MLLQLSQPYQCMLAHFLPEYSALLSHFKSILLSPPLHPSYMEAVLLFLHHYCPRMPLSLLELQALTRNILAHHKLTLVAEDVLPRYAGPDQRQCIYREVWDYLQAEGLNVHKIIDMVTMHELALCKMGPQLVTAIEGAIEGGGLKEVCYEAVKGVI